MTSKGIGESAIQDATHHYITPLEISNEIILVGPGMQRLLDNLSDIINRFKQKIQTLLNPSIVEFYRT